jgi:hypothetical protein
VKELRLWEISAVTFAADPMAKIYAVHSVVSFQDLPLAEEGTKWASGAAHTRLVNACDCKGENPDWTMFKKAHLWFDPQNADKITGYGFQIADVVDGKLQAVPRAIFAAAAVLQGARGGTTISEEDQTKMKTHLARYYTKLGKTAPWDKTKDAAELELETLFAFFPDLEQFENKVLSAKNKKLLTEAMDMLKALLAASEPADPEGEGGSGSSAAAQGTSKQSLDTQANDKKGSGKKAMTCLSGAITTHQEHIADPKCLTNDRQASIMTQLQGCKKQLEKLYASIEEEHQLIPTAEPSGQQTLTDNEERLTKLGNLQLWLAQSN